MYNFYIQISYENRDRFISLFYNIRIFIKYAKKNSIYKSQYNYILII